MFALVCSPFQEIKAQQTPAVDVIEDPTIPKTPLINDVNAKALGGWQVIFGQRMAKKKQIADQLKQALEIEKVDSFRKSVQRSARLLDIESSMRERLLSIAARTKSGEPVESEEASGATPEIVSLKDAKKMIVAIANDLAFAPTFESELPNNFPAPTPVGEIEIKKYPSYRMAKTDSQDGSAFARLFNHIKTNEISMTSPVQMQYEEAPKGETMRESSMAFLYPDQKTGDISDQGEVCVIDTEPASFISMGMRGKPSAKDVATAASKLREASLHFPSKFELKNEIRLLGYNSPSVPAENQFFEIQIEIVTPDEKLGKKSL